MEMKRPALIKGISAAAVTIICGYFGTQYLGKNIMYVIGGTIAGTGITAFLADQTGVDQTGVIRIVLGQPQPSTQPTTCIGCKYYHGSSYGGVHLICAVHPDGWEGAKCPDWQGFQQCK